MAYFDDGLRAGEAMRLHEKKLLMEENAGVLTADASINPSRRTVHYLRNLWRELHYGQEWSSDPMSKLKEKIAGYAERGKNYFSIKVQLQYKSCGNNNRTDTKCEML